VANLKKYDISGKEIGDVAIDDAQLTLSVNSQMVKDYVVAIRNNARQWSANTKGRSEIAHSNQKPHPQKGTGRARQGCITVAQYRGGAVVFGPKPKKDQHVRINRKERQQAIRFLLAQMIQSQNVHILKLESLASPKTKTVSQLLKAMGIDKRRTLVLADQEEETKKTCINFVKSARNIPKMSFMPMLNISGYDVMKNQEIIVIESALDQLMKVIGA